MRRVFDSVAWCCLLHYRGVRAGRRVRVYLTGQPSVGDSTHCPVTTIIGHRPTPRHHRLRHNGTPSSVLVYPQCKQPGVVTKIGLLNTQSIGNKYALIVDCITSNDFSFFAAVETWLDSSDCPSIIACTPDGYRSIEQVRSRSAKNELTTKTNHGGVCLFYRTRYTVRRLKLSSYKSMELLAIHVTRATANLMLVVVYRPGSQIATSVSFDDFTDLVERMAVQAYKPLQSSSSATLTCIWMISLLHQRSVLRAS